MRSPSITTCVSDASITEQVATRPISDAVPALVEQALQILVNLLRNAIEAQCQALGRSSVGENLRPDHLVNWVRLAHNADASVPMADFAGQSAQQGILVFVGYLALISISLGVLNLLPVPLLDGGHLLYYLVEVFKGSPVSDRALEVGQRIGMAVLALLMALALFNDLSRFL